NASPGTAGPARMPQVSTRPGASSREPRSTSEGRGGTSATFAVRPGGSRLRMSRPQEELAMSTTDVPDLGSHTVAWFRSSAEVRAAESALERDGIESHYIEVSRPPVASNRREIDRKTWGSLGTRAAVGVVIGAAIGALVGVVVGLLLG